MRLRQAKNALVMAEFRDLCQNLCVQADTGVRHARNAEQERLQIIQMLDKPIKCL